MSFVSLLEDFGNSMLTWDPDLLPYSISENYNELSSAGPSSNTLQHSNSVTLANQVTPTCTINKQMSSCMQENSLPYSHSNHSMTNTSIKNITNGIVTFDRRSSESSYFEEPSSFATSKTPSTLSDDQLMHLALKRNPSVKSEPFLCQYCGKEYSSQWLLMRHIKKHNGEKLHACSTCGHRFAELSDLNRHNRTHTGEKPFECQVCGERFSLASIREIHQRKHTGEKPYPCSKCGRCYTHKSALTQHNRTHTGEKPYECHVCGKRFSRASIREIHQRKHTGEKPYDCSTCGRCFTQKSTLNTYRYTQIYPSQHNRMHTGEKPYACSTCGRRFTQQSAFK